MTDDESVLREVDRAVAEDRQWDVLRKHGPALVAGAVLIVGSVGGWQLWTSHKGARASETALVFNSAAKTLRTSPEDGRAALEALAADAPEGYAALAMMRRASALANEGDRTGALAAYREIYNNGGAAHRLRELARLRAASLSLPDGRDAVLADLGSLTESADPFGPYARELSAIAALEAKDYEAALEMFTRAAEDPSTPAPIRQRAEEFAPLAAAGKAGVNLTGEARVDDLQQALEGAAKHAAPPPESEAPADPAQEEPEPATEGEEPNSAPEGGALRQDQ